MLVCCEDNLQPIVAKNSLKAFAITSLSVTVSPLSFTDSIHVDLFLFFPRSMLIHCHVFLALFFYVIEFIIVKFRVKPV